MNQENKKTCVLYVITKATYGGAQRYVYDLATSLPRNEFEPMVAFGIAGLLARDLASAGIRTFTLRSLGRDIALFSDVASFFQLLVLLRALRPEVVHLNSSKAAALGAIAARILGVKRIIFTVHGWPFGERRNALIRALIWFASWCTALAAHRVICVSEYDLAIARRMPLIGRKAARIYNGIDLTMSFGPGDIVRSAFPSGAIIRGTIGELHRNKNQRTLIEQAKHNPQMFVAIVGEGEERARLEKKITQYGLHERVHLFGFLPARDVLRGFDVFALPSQKEGLPYVLLEAKLAGIPIEASRVGGVGEVLDKPIEEFSLEKMIEQTLALYRTIR